MAFVLVFNFFLFRLLPGDPIALYTRGRNMDREQLRELRRQLNKPIGDQFLDYLRNPFSTGVDSTQFSRPVWDVIGDYVWPTLVLLGTSTVLAAVIGIAIGISGGWKRGSTFDRGSHRDHADPLRDARVLARHDAADPVQHRRRHLPGDLPQRRHAHAGPGPVVLRRDPRPGLAPLPALR